MDNKQGLGLWVPESVLLSKIAGTTPVQSSSRGLSNDKRLEHKNPFESLFFTYDGDEPFLSPPIRILLKNYPNFQSQDVGILSPEETKIIENFREQFLSLLNQGRGTGFSDKISFLTLAFLHFGSKAPRGQLRRVDLDDLYKAYPQTFNGEEGKNIFWECLDSNNSASISRLDFISGFIAFSPEINDSLKSYEGKLKLQHIFKLYDKDKDRILNKDELKLLIFDIYKKSMFENLEKSALQDVDLLVSKFESFTYDVFYKCVEIGAIQHTEKLFRGPADLAEKVKEHLVYALANIQILTTIDQVREPLWSNTISYPSNYGQFRPFDYRDKVYTPDDPFSNRDIGSDVSDDPEFSNRQGIQLPPQAINAARTFDIKRGGSGVVSEGVRDENLISELSSRAKSLVNGYYNRYIGFQSENFVDQKIALSVFTSMYSIFFGLDNDRICEKLEPFKWCTYHDLFKLCNTFSHLLTKEPNIVPLKSPVRVIGELGSNFTDLIRTLNLYGWPLHSSANEIESPLYFVVIINQLVDSKNKYSHFLECLLLVMSLKVLFPKHVTVLGYCEKPNDLIKAYNSQLYKEIVDKLKKYPNELNINNTAGADSQYSKELLNRIINIFDLGPKGVIIDDNIAVKINENVEGFPNKLSILPGSGSSGIDFGSISKSLNGLGGTLRLSNTTANGYDSASLTISGNNIVYNPLSPLGDNRSDKLMQ